MRQTQQSFYLAKSSKSSSRNWDMQNSCTNEIEVSSAQGLEKRAIRNRHQPDPHVESPAAAAAAVRHAEGK